MSIYTYKYGHKNICIYHSIFLVKIIFSIIDCKTFANQTTLLCHYFLEIEFYRQNAADWSVIRGVIFAYKRRNLFLFDGFGIGVWFGSRANRILQCFRRLAEIVCFITSERSSFLVHNQKENCCYNYILFNLKGSENLRVCMYQ